MRNVDGLGGGNMRCWGNDTPLHCKNILCFHSLSLSRHLQMFKGRRDIFIFNKHSTKSKLHFHWNFHILLASILLVLIYTLPHDFISFYHVTIIILSLPHTRNFLLLVSDARSLQSNSPHAIINVFFASNLPLAHHQAEERGGRKLWLCFSAVRREGRRRASERERNFSFLLGDEMMKTRRELKRKTWVRIDVEETKHCRLRESL